MPTKVRNNIKFCIIIYITNIGTTREIGTFYITLQISFKRILTWKALRNDSESGIIKRRVSTGNDKHNLERQRETR